MRDHSARVLNPTLRSTAVTSVTVRRQEGGREGLRGEGWLTGPQSLLNRSKVWGAVAQQDKYR